MGRIQRIAQELAKRKLAPGNEAFKMATTVSEIIDDLDKEQVQKNIEQESMDVEEVKKKLASLEKSINALTELVEVLKGKLDGSKDGNKEIAKEACDKTEVREGEK